MTISEQIFHYTVADTAKKILESASLQMNTLEGLNDPRESKTWPLKFSARSQHQVDGDLFSAATNLIVRQTQLLCFVTDSNLSTSRSHEGRSLIGTGFARPRMWAQYGGNHEGACLVFDKSALEARAIDLLPSAWTGNVRYVKSAAELLGDAGDPYYVLDVEAIGDRGLESVIEDHLRRHCRQLFFSKHTDWRDESEYRVVVRTTESERIPISISDCLSEVIVGSQCHSEHVDEIAALCGRHSWPLHRMFWHGWEAMKSEDLLNPSSSRAVSLDGLLIPIEPTHPHCYARAQTADGNYVVVSFDTEGDRMVLTIDGVRAAELPVGDD